MARRRFAVGFRKASTMRRTLDARLRRDYRIARRCLVRAEPLQRSAISYKCGLEVDARHVHKMMVFAL